MAMTCPDDAENLMLFVRRIESRNNKHVV